MTNVIKIFTDLLFDAFSFDTPNASTGLCQLSKVTSACNAYITRALTTNEIDDVTEFLFYYSASFPFVVT